ncbi:hypothetical protein GCM10011586_19470 [Silvibacterium dinghuense]|nr:hypothetical protein GCM10011586_19470 [Silvibacterium dinghuense]
MQREAAYGLGCAKTHRETIDLKQGSHASILTAARRAGLAVQAFRLQLPHPLVASRHPRAGSLFSRIKRESGCPVQALLGREAINPDVLCRPAAGLGGKAGSHRQIC